MKAKAPNMNLASDEQSLFPNVFKEFCRKYFYICNAYLLTLILIFIVCPSLKLRSNLGPASNGFEASIFSCSSLFTTLKTTCNSDNFVRFAKNVLIYSLLKTVRDWHLFYLLEMILHSNTKVKRIRSILESYSNKCTST